MDKLSGYLQKIEQINFNRYLRRSFVDRAVPVLKITFSLLSILVLVICTRDIVENSLARETSIKDFQNQIHAVTAGLNSENRKQRPDRDYKAITKRQLFGELGVQATPTAPPAEKPKTTLDLRLVGVFIVGNQPPLAIIEGGKDKSQKAFGIGDSIFDVASLIAIKHDSVEINRDGSPEVLTIEEASAGAGVSSGTGGVVGVSSTEFVVEEGELNKALENMPLLLTQARAVPYFQDGKSIGFRLFAIKAGSLYEKIGLKNGDIVKSVNGNSMADPSQALKLFEELKKERSLSVNLERQKVEMEFRYSIR